MFEESQRQLALLFAGRSGLIELRSHARGRWQQRFVDTARVDRAAALAVRLSAWADVYVGVVPRERRGGGRRDLVKRADVVWADLDDPDGHGRLDAFAASPSLVVASGTLGHLHAYWRLDGPLEIVDLERVNRALASRLGADENSCDAARVLRVAGTRSHKRQPPAAVTIERRRDEPVALRELLAAVGPLPPARVQRDPHLPGHARVDAVAPEVYVRVLTGQSVGRSRKVRCPLHDDQTASLHVYPDAARGWYCFGCRRGGTVYDLAAALWGRPLRGKGFLELRRDVQARLDLAA